MNSQEFYLWLNGYLEALESEGILECKIENVRKKMQTVKFHQNTQERIIFGPNVSPNPQQSNYAPNPPVSRK